jgi:hypothetical protein
MKTVNTIASVFFILVGLAFLNVGIRAIIDPKSVMDFVNTELTNISARNSIRAFYGGVNTAFALFIIYAVF